MQGRVRLHGGDSKMSMIVIVHACCMPHAQTHKTRGSMHTRHTPDARAYDCIVPRYACAVCRLRWEGHPQDHFTVAWDQRLHLSLIIEVVSLDVLVRVSVLLAHGLVLLRVIRSGCGWCCWCLGGRGCAASGMVLALVLSPEMAVSYQVPVVS